MSRNNNIKQVAALVRESGYNTPKSSCPGVYAMTLCVSALCENRDAIVCVADRLLTVTYSNGEVIEMEGQTKIYEPTTYFSVLCSGDACAFSPLNDILMTKIGAAIETATPSMYETSQMVVDTFQEMGSKYKINFGDTDIILAGFDSFGGHIYVVSKTDGAAPQDGIGFAAVGCGDGKAHAALTRMGHDKSAAVLPTILMAYIAKRESECVKGVGKKTDILVNFRGTQRAIRDNTEVMRIMDEYYKEHKKCRSQKSRKSANIKYQELLKPLMKHLFG